jgi:flagellar biosynthesis/type III secretory pathway protein FliH
MLEITVDDWLEQSKEDGRKEGRKEGKQEGEALMLIRLLETKFGALEAQTRATLFDLDTETLLKCAERLLTAQTVQEVIGR